MTFQPNTTMDTKIIQHVEHEEWKYTLEWSRFYGLQLRWDVKCTKLQPSSAVAVISSSAISGKLYVAKTGYKIFCSIFGYHARKDDNVMRRCVVVCCNTGQIFAVDLSVNEATVKHLMFSTNPLIWVGSLVLGEKSTLGILKSNGSIMIGFADQNEKLKWISINLKHFPIVCEGLKDKIILSDGVKCYLVTFTWCSDDIEHSITILKYQGVIQMNYSDEQCFIELITTTGHRVKKEIACLGNSDKCLNMTNSVSVVNESSINRLTSSLNTCSKMIKEEDHKLNKMILFLNQLNVVKELIVEPNKNIITVQNMKVIYSSSKNIYLVDLNLLFSEIGKGNNNNNNENLHLHIKSLNHMLNYHSFTCLKCLNNSNNINISIEVPLNVVASIIKLNDVMCLKLKCSIVLKSLTSSGILCSVDVSEFHIELVDFIYPYKVDFDTMYTKQRNNDQLRKDIDHDATIKVENKWLIKLANIFPSINDLTKDTKSTCIMWLLNEPIKFEFQLLSNENINIVFRSSDLCILLAIKHSLYHKCFGYDKNRDIILDYKNLNHVYSTQNMIDMNLKSSSPSIHSGVLYNIANKLLSALP